ncbi:SDR family oxidoreductase [Brucella anthropi]|uniref:SDR family oxidoreductase n=2 Tax=Brucella TaxID=234 RepID=A0A011TNF6_BRUAN|nr:MULTISPECIES: SDR family oxidoreductase [Brucella/Ochrobactrum group]MCR5943396.1 SDR family oxidoreductase [Ochrobactrum sp. XJ1]QOD64670.1 SDR family oxidoreductase [Ochrobactrum sp. MT180101]QTN02787.1 SDR family oxidoreductase [Ochrobactrum sp. EEELCW01]RNL44259.1 SDR family oxidoreductase [Ochrobactrum sp. MH181795]EXL05597.1 3-oxoacyl-ACP reductase [Brucella anthropi]
MDLGLKGRKAIVCASSKGLGRACAEALAEAGCDLVLNGRNEETLATTAEAIRKTFGVKVDAVVADVSTAEGQAKLLAACPAPDILVNNNGGPAFKDFRLLDRDAILQGVTQNMVTPIELIKAVIDGMVERRFGRIVNITSTSVYAPIPGLDLSSGARAGLTAFLAGVARTVAASNVTINNILPGAFDTDRLRNGFAFSAQKNGTTADAEAAKRASAIPAGRIGQPKEFGQACAFLCSEHSGFITGQNLVIDGGAYQSAF